MGTLIRKTLEGAPGLPHLSNLPIQSPQPLISHFARPFSIKARIQIHKLSDLFKCESGLLRRSDEP